MAGEINIGEKSISDWVFLISLAIIAVGIFGWYINRSLVELATRLDKSGDGPKYSYLQAWFLPKHKAGLGRWANEEFHDYVDAKSKNLISRISLSLVFVGVLIQSGFWIYVYKFSAEGL